MNVIRLFCIVLILSAGGVYADECISGDCQNGQGTLTSPDGKEYVGEFKNGKYNGQGTLTFPDKSKYVGEYKDGKYDGQGTFTYRKATISEGAWIIKYERMSVSGKMGKRTGKELIRGQIRGQINRSMSGNSKIINVTDKEHSRIEMVAGLRLMSVSGR
jgi:hypothetical protein